MYVCGQLVMFVHTDITENNKKGETWKVSTSLRLMIQCARIINICMLTHA